MFTRKLHRYGKNEDCLRRMVLHKAHEVSSVFYQPIQMYMFSSGMHFFCKTAKHISGTPPGHEK